MRISICLILIIFLTDTFGDYQLKHVQIVYRHGDRSPVYIYPNDINKMDKWPNGMGQLTDVGIREQYHLGVWLRRRYTDLFGPRFNNSDIFIRSTDYDRTLMSAEANVAGLMFNDSHKIIPGLSWRPVPIHTINAKQDYLLDYNACPRYVSEKESLYNLDYFKKKFAPYQSLLLYLRQVSGMSDLGFSTIWMLYDNLFCEINHNFTINKWVTKDVWRNLTEINKINWELLFYNNLAKLTGGLLLYTITENMMKISDGDPKMKEGLKMVMYSGHDTDVAPLAKLLGFYKNEQPPFCSSILFELYHDINLTDPWAVKVFYKNDSDSSEDVHIKSYLIPGCPSVMCPLSTFIKVTKKNSMTKNEFVTQCFLATKVVIYIQWVFIAVCALIFLVVALMFYIRCYRRRSVHYSRINSNKDIQ